ncbi:MAG TPA: hypothetical protein VMV23_12540, partial [Candidatus Nanopelagicaceae bacterium]|nr:hypothetical protein [Candidatus Nanopelagicaceae bacterium]
MARQPISLVVADMMKLPCLPGGAPLQGRWRPPRATSLEPPAQRYDRWPAYLQQLEMDGKGEHVDLMGCMSTTKLG